LHDVFVDEMRDMYNAEQQITKALPKMIKAAGSGELRRAFEFHLGETENQIDRLERAFSLLKETPKGKKCDGMEGILEEGKKVMEDAPDGPVLDAALIAGAQRVEHYETAAYGTLVAWAQAMGHTDVARLLQESLEEEKNADKTLSSLAEGGINQAALSEEDDEEMSEEDEDRPRTSVKRGNGRSSTRPSPSARAAKRR
jgi:ferritin-like metal-binding protein YciE